MTLLNVTANEVACRLCDQYDFTFDLQTRSMLELPQLGKSKYNKTIQALLCYAELSQPAGTTDERGNEIYAIPYSFLIPNSPAFPIIRKSAVGEIPTPRNLVFFNEYPYQPAVVQTVTSMGHMGLLRTKGLDVEYHPDLSLTDQFLLALINPNIMLDYRLS